MSKDHLNEQRPWPDARGFNAMVRAAHLRISQVTFVAAVPPEPHPSTPLAERWDRESFRAYWREDDNGHEYG